MSENTQSVLHNLRLYKRKYYQNLLLRGLLWSLSVLLVIFLLFAFAEYVGRFSTSVRSLFFFSFLIAAGAVLFFWILRPLAHILRLAPPFSDEKAARQLGERFPNVRDKLLNLLQLQELQPNPNSLAWAGLEQKAGQLQHIPFNSAIRYKTNLPYLKIFLGILLFILLVGLLMPGLLSEAPERLVKYRQEFIPPAPFSFVLKNDKLQAFKNEDYTLQLSLEGEVQPSEAFLIVNDRKIRLAKNKAGVYAYTFNRLQNSLPFRFEAAGFQSQPYRLEVLSRPVLRQLQVQLQYPEYLKRKNETLLNSGNLQVPEGTQAQWLLQTQATDSVKWAFADTAITIKQPNDQLFSTEKQLVKSQPYEIKLYNQWSLNKDPIAYTIEVIPDRRPDISLNQFQDTTFYRQIILGGNVTDDYGLSRLRLYYRIRNNKEKEEPAFKTLALPLSPGQASQAYYYPWQLDSLTLQAGDQLEYYLAVWDNDGFNGPKASQTALNSFRLPTKDEIKDRLNEAEEKIKEEISTGKQQTRQLEEKLQEAQDRLRGKKQIDYRDERLLQDIMQQRQKLEEKMQELQQQNQALDEQRKQFSPEKQKELQEKAEQLQKLMEELLDEETKELYEELQRLLEEQRKDSEEFAELIKQIQNQESNTEKELERALELFKRLEFESQMEDTRQQLEELAQEQEELAKETDQKNTGTEKLSEQQQDIQKEFEALKKQLEELEKKNQELKAPNSLQDFSPEEEAIEQNMQQSQENLQQGKQNKAKKAQQKASEQMRKMAQKMEMMQNGMQMEMMQENLDQLRNIVDDLVKLSFTQEAILDEFKGVNQANPRYIELGQEQLAVQDDMEILEDSLQSLAERVFQIQAFVTRELSDLNRHMESSMTALRERKKGEALSSQQFAMTSMNNLALMLDDVLQQMQQQMADAMSAASGKEQKPGQNMPSLSELQKQLGQRIQQLKQSGKQGRELSEELAKMAAQQEQIREALKKMEEEYGKGEQGTQPGEQGLRELMEETEEDLVNKRLDRELLERQQEIITRLLETESALRERELDEERKGETAKPYEQQLPAAFEEYLKQKQKEIELLKSIPPKLNPYYKEEVNKYFQKLGSSK